jgi:glucokinase
MTRRVIGLDAGGTKLLAGVVDDGGDLLYRSVHPWPAAVTREEVCALFVRAVAEARDAAGEVDAVGVGLPATMDIAAGVAVGCRHLPIAGFPFRDWLALESDLPVFADNDATMALLAEARLGAARGVDEVVMLTIGTGIGGGIMSAGNLVRGARGAAGEPGHMSIDVNGPPCPSDCPGHGCLEGYVSGPALARIGLRYAEMAPDYNLGRMVAEHGGLTGADVVHAARAGDPGAVEALNRMGEKLGVGLANLLNLLDPELVLIGGGFGADAGPLLLERAEWVARERALEPAASRARFEVAGLGEDSGMLGAALLALAGGEL